MNEGCKWWAAVELRKKIEGDFARRLGEALARSPWQLVMKNNRTPTEFSNHESRINTLKLCEVMQDFGLRPSPIPEKVGLALAKFEEDESRTKSGMIVLAPDEVAIRPNIENNTAYCTGEDCPGFDGKRCQVMGFRPSELCEPWMDERGEEEG